jgi:hypothetical protein
VVISHLSRPFLPPSLPPSLPHFLGELHCHL